MKTVGALANLIPRALFPSKVGKEKCPADETNQTQHFMWTPAVKFLYFTQTNYTHKITQWKLTLRFILMIVTWARVTRHIQLREHWCCFGKFTAVVTLNPIKITQTLKRAQQFYFTIRLQARVFYEQIVKEV